MAIFDGMTNEDLLEAESIVSGEIGELTLVQIAHPPVVPLCVLQLVNERHKFLQDLWFSQMRALHLRGLRSLNPIDD